MEVAFYKSPIGILKIFSSDYALHKIQLVDARNDFECSAFNYNVMEQLDEYFAGRLFTFNIPVEINAATEFEKKVYDALLSIRYGKTKTYKELAQMIGVPGGSRAVGNALAKNPVPLVMPCHRIIKSNGQIGKFALGTDAKKYLLDFEKSNS